MSQSEKSAPLSASQAYRIRLARGYQSHIATKGYQGNSKPRTSPPPPPPKAFTSAVMKPLPKK